MHKLNSRADEGCNGALLWIATALYENFQWLQFERFQSPWNQFDV